MESIVCAKCRLRAGGGTRWSTQVPVLSIVTIVHGVLVTLLGAVYLMLAVLLAFAPSETRHAGDPPPEFMFVFMTCFGLLQLLPGVLQIVAGVRLHRARGRAFAMIALASGMVTMLGCYCFATSVLLAVWGLIVLNDAEVRAQFDREASA